MVLSSRTCFRVLLGVCALTVDVSGSSSTFTVVDGWNAVPSGAMTTQASLDECQDTCTGSCNQFSWNKNSHHCFTSVDTKWAGSPLDHVSSGCRPDKVDGCGPKPFTVVDGWNAVPSGAMTTQASLDECRDTCTGSCNQFSWNKNSHHCFTSLDTKWAGYPLDHVSSGCRPDKVDGCGKAPSPSPPSPPSPQQFDGMLRPNGIGRLDAYLSPPFKSNHASMVEQLPNGALHMAWFSGTSEGHDDVSIVYAHLDNHTAGAGATWSQAKVVSRRDGYSNQNAVVYFDKVSSKLHLFHSQQGAGAGESRATVWHLQAPVSAGIVEDFSTPHEVLSKPGSFDKNRVVPLLDGSWLLPIYGQDKSPNYPKNAFLPAGADPDDQTAWKVGTYNDCDNMVQPSVVRPQPGKPNLVAFFRDRKERNIYRATSANDGKTWSPCKATVLPNNNAGIEAYALRSGRIALTYNPQTHGRDPLSISLSEDGGITWKYTRVLEHLDGHQEFSYPTLREDVNKDGVIHVSYTFKRQCIKHSIVSEDWIMQKQEVII